MAGETSFQSLNLNKVQGQLLALYEQVAHEKGRVEIVHNDGACDCVLISKTELESLEHALEVLGNSEAVRELSAQMEQVVGCLST